MTAKPANRKATRRRSDTWSIRRHTRYRRFSPSCIACNKRLGVLLPCEAPAVRHLRYSAWDPSTCPVFWPQYRRWVTSLALEPLGICGQGKRGFSSNNQAPNLMGWFATTSGLNSSQLINGYNRSGRNTLDVWALMFPFGHSGPGRQDHVLISWRG